MSGTQLVILVYFGLISFALQVYVLLVRPFAPSSILGVVSLILSALWIYVGVRFKRLIATVPRRIEWLVYAEAILLVVAVAVHVFAPTAPPPGVLRPALTPWRAAADAVILLAIELLIYGTLLWRIRFHANAARRADQSPSSA